MNLKQTALQLLRRARLLEHADSARFRWLTLRQGDARAAFARRHAAAPLPPDDLAYDAYGTLDWDFYWGFGRHIVGVLGPRIAALGLGGRVLEWGCGPARIVRHLPEVLGAGWDVYGSDANPKTVAWCAANIPGVHFDVNGAAPPLPYPTASFDCLYSVSVFTHLPAELHGPWTAELHRVLKPGGTLICTLNGDASRQLLLPAERPAYDAGRLVVRGGVTGGTRCFVAYHPPAYVTGDLLRDFDVIEHLPAPNPFGERQDLWTARARRER
jgi:SAM-dependent methyltransferase